MKKLFKSFLVVLNIIFYLVVIGLWISIPEEWTLNVSTAIFTLGLTAIMIILDKGRFQGYYSSSQFKRLCSALVSIFLVFCILGMINYLGFKNPRQIDLTQGKKNSLSKKTVEIVRRIEGEVAFKVFSKRSEFASILALLELYRFQKNDISIDYIDQELRPDLVKKYGITHPQTIVVEYRGKKKVVLDRNELGITNALINVSRKKGPIIYYSMGHQELSLAGKSDSSLSELNTILQDNLYKLKQVYLSSITKIPEDVDALIIWGPKTGFLDSEISIISRYIAQGGKLLVALDPDLNEDKVIKLRNFLKSLGIKVNNNLVVDKISHVNGSKGSVPLVTEFDREHYITRNLQGPVFFPLVSSIQVVLSDDMPSVSSDSNKLDSLMVTSTYPGSWADNDPKEIVKGELEFNEGRDQKGPVTLVGLWANGGKPEFPKMVVFGNSSFVTNAYSKFGSNLLLFINSLSWLVDKDLIPSFNLPKGKNDPVFISTTQMGVIFYFSIVFVPMLLFLMGLIFFRRRRKL